jgi:hypothetical protein
VIAATRWELWNAPIVGACMLLKRLSVLALLVSMSSGPDSRVVGKKRRVSCEGKSLRAGLLFVLLSLPLGCASQKTTLESTQRSRFADSSEFTFELRSVYYDQDQSASGGGRGPVARFRFRNLTRSVLQVYGYYLTYRHEGEPTESKTALESTCNSLQREGVVLAANPAGRPCWPDAIDLLPDRDYTIDVQLFQIPHKVEAKAVGSVSIAGPGKTFTSTTFPLDRLASALPEHRRYPTNGDLPIPNENRFVMSFDAVRNLEKLGGAQLSREAYFVPSDIEVLDANRAILRSLLTPRGNELFSDEFFCDHSGCQEFIVNFLDQYCVQYWGRVERKSKRRVVAANFFLCHKRGELGYEYPERSSEIVSVKGGGASFWAASYDVESKKVEIYANSPR